MIRPILRLYSCAFVSQCAKTMQVTVSVRTFFELGNSFLLAALSNGSIDMLRNISNNANLVWDYVISAEMFGTYKPDPKVYIGAASVLDLPPENIIMVAAHKYDLEAAKAQGMHTAFIMRLEEFGSLRDFDVASESFIDVYAYDFHQLATELGA